MNYLQWLQIQKDKGVNLCRARDIMVDGKAKEGLNLVIRHDIDAVHRKGVFIRRMAAVEKTIGIRASYYIILNYGYYNKHLDLFHKLQNQGHEIGLHVNSVEVSNDPWKGRTKEEAIKILRSDVERIKQDFDVVTMCAHGIKWPYTNKDLLRDYEIPGVVAFNRFFKDRDCILNDSRGVVNMSEGKHTGNKYALLHLSKSLRFSIGQTPEELTDEQLSPMV